MNRMIAATVHRSCPRHRKAIARRQHLCSWSGVGGISVPEHAHLPCHLLLRFVPFTLSHEVVAELARR
jgi:hypothetical protein